MSLKAKFRLTSAPTGPNHVTTRIEYAVNGIEDRPYFEIPAAQSEFDLPGPNGGTLNHGDSISIKATPLNAGGVAGSVATLVHVLQDTSPPPAFTSIEFVSSEVV